MAKILIIDDEVQIGKGLEKFLNRQGFQVIVALDGETGLAAALQKPDLIICDLNMPSLNGQGVLSALRQDKRMEDIPFIFYSGSGDSALIRQSINLGSDDFISKPAPPVVILEAINARLLRHQRQQHRHEAEVKKAVQIFSGIVDDLGDAEAAIHWLSAAAATGSEAPLPPREPMPTAATPAPARPAAPDSFLATKDNRRFFVKLSEVKVLLADGEYSKAFWGRDQSMIFRKPLKQWERELPPQQFIRIHRKAIINLAYLDYVVAPPGGTPLVHLRDYSAALEVSQRKVPVLNRSLNSPR